MIHIYVCICKHACTALLVLPDGKFDIAKYILKNSV